MLPVSGSVVDHSVIIQALKEGLIEHETSDTGGVPRWKSSCPDRLAEDTVQNYEKYGTNEMDTWERTLSERKIKFLKVRSVLKGYVLPKRNVLPK